jgi:uncharacterized membrane protein YidH (DUF202 family)
MKSPIHHFLCNPTFGSVLTVAAGISFFFTCMCLPYVGRSGASVPYADKNQWAFLGVLGVTFIIAALASWSKMARRADDHSPLPLWSLGLCVVCALLFVLQWTGLLAI